MIKIFICNFVNCKYICSNLDPIEYHVNLYIETWIAVNFYLFEQIIEDDSLWHGFFFEEIFFIALLYDGQLLRHLITLFELLLVH